MEVTKKETFNYSIRDKNNRMNKLLGDVPSHIKRQFRRDDEALWSFTHVDLADELCEVLLRLPGITCESVITDATASVGGNTIPFAKHFAHVNAVEKCCSRSVMLRHNCALFQLTNVAICNDEYQNLCQTLYQDVVYIDPPWGIDYKKYEYGTLRLVLPGTELIAIEDLISSISAKFVVVKLPINYDFVWLFSNVNRIKVWTKTYDRPNSHTIIIFDTQSS